MDLEMKIDIEAGYWLTAAHACPACKSAALVTVLVVIKGREWWDEEPDSIDEPSFVIDVDCDLPLEVVRQRWELNPNLGMPTEGERMFSSLTNVCQHCGTPAYDASLIGAGGPFMQRKAAAVARMTCAPLEHVPFTVSDAEVCDGDGLRGLLRRITHQG